MPSNLSSNEKSRRRRFLTRLTGLGVAGTALGQTPARTAPATYRLPEYALAQDYQSLKQSSYDRTGGNADRWPVEPGDTKEVFNATGPGVITHIWFTISATSARHLKEIVLRIYWDGNAKPSVETPIGDFFGLNLGQYFVYQSAYLNCSSVQSAELLFRDAVPQVRADHRRTIEGDSARRRVLFEYRLPTGALASRTTALYFHAQYRQSTPNTAMPFPEGAPKLNLDGAEELRLHGNSRRRSLDGRDARRLAESRRLDGRRRRHDFYR